MTRVEIPEDPAEEVSDQPFAEGALDIVGPDLRHWMLSEVAHQRYVECGYSDGDDLDDWLQAEADIDHFLPNRRVVPPGVSR